MADRIFRVGYSGSKERFIHLIADLASMQKYQVKLIEKAKLSYSSYEAALLMEDKPATKG